MPRFGWTVSIEWSDIASGHRHAFAWNLGNLPQTTKTCVVLKCLWRAFELCLWGAMWKRTLIRSLCSWTSPVFVSVRFWWRKSYTLRIRKSENSWMCSTTLFQEPSWAKLSQASAVLAWDPNWIERCETGCGWSQGARAELLQSMISNSETWGIRSLHQDLQEEAHGVRWKNSDFSIGRGSIPCCESHPFWV